MPESENARLARRWFKEVWNQRRDATVLELLDPKIEGQMEGVDVRSPEDFLKARAGLLDGFPDLSVIVDDVVSEGDNVVVRLVVSQGRIVKGWDSWNLGQLFQQLTTPSQ